MKYRGLISLLAVLCVAVISTVVAPGCANIVPPSGGPRDSTPPELLKATPGDSARNFTGNRIVLTFDEYIDIQNLQQELIMSPSPKTFPIVDNKQKTLTIRLKDSLEANTTYTLNFGSAIKDFNEGNALKDFTFTFSTGRYIDSLELNGNVILAENGKIDTTLIVMLHTNPADSAVKTERPRYVTKLDSKGSFTFRNLPPKTFYLYALKDEGGTKRYFNTKLLFAFADHPIVVDGKNTPVTLYAYAEKDTTAAPATSTRISTTPTSRTNRLGGGNVVERLRFQTSLNNAPQDLLSQFVITFDQPLKMYDSTKIRLYTDTSFNPVPDSSYSFDRDSTSRKITLRHTWKENTGYHIILDKDFAEDKNGHKLLKTDTLNFATKKLADYGQLHLKFRNLDMSKNPVLIFVQNENVIKSVVLTKPEFSSSVFLPGDYDMRILYDTNKNGIWDPGEFFGKRKQPELVKPIDRKITVKTAWENEFEIQL